mgnify:CR=1 FL=1
MHNIRHGWETNSSSVHQVAIRRKNPDSPKLAIPEKLLVRTTDYGDDHPLTDPQGKFDILVAACRWSNYEGGSLATLMKLVDVLHTIGVASIEFDRDLWNGSCTYMSPECAEYFIKRIIDKPPGVVEDFLFNPNSQWVSEEAHDGHTPVHFVEDADNYDILRFVDD